jgi:hypothetical protein
MAAEAPSYAGSAVDSGPRGRYSNSPPFFVVVSSWLPLCTSPPFFADRFGGENRAASVRDHGLNLRWSRRWSTGIQSKV